MKRSVLIVVCVIVGLGAVASFAFGSIDVMLKINPKRAIQMAINEMNVPTRLNADMTVNNVRAKDKTMIFVIEISDKIVRKARAYTQADLLNIVCHDEQNKRYLNNGITLQYNFIKRNGEGVNSISATKELCAA